MQRHVASSQHDLLSVAYQRCKERLRSCHSGTSDSEVIESTIFKRDSIVFQRKLQNDKIKDGTSRSSVAPLTIKSFVSQNLLWQFDREKKKGGASRSSSPEIFLKKIFRAIIQVKRKDATSRCRCQKRTSFHIILYERFFC